VGQSFCQPVEESFMHRALLLTAFAAALAVPSVPASAQTLDDIVALNLKAKGGLEKIRATETVRMTGTIAARDPGGHEMKANMVILAKRPNLMRRETTVEGQRSVMAFDGKTFWMARSDRPPQQLPGAQAAYAMQDAEFDSVFVDYKEKGHKITLAGKETLDGQPVYHLKVAKKNGPVQDFYLDAETGLEKKISVQVAAPDQPPATFVTEMSDYRDVDGRQIPFKTRQSQNGVVMSTVTLEKVEFNVPTDDAEFRMPPAK
jgi:outer membrane lipoprotein-sorting protein